MSIFKATKNTSLAPQEVYATFKNSAKEVQIFFSQRDASYLLCTNGVLSLTQEHYTTEDDIFRQEK